MRTKEILTPEQVRPLYDLEIVPAYQAAFGKDSIWGEETKCADPRRRCVSGFSPLVVGEQCTICSQCVTTPAYSSAELTERFETLAASRPTAWYVERNEAARVTLAAVAWIADANTIAAEKYGSDVKMGGWLKAVLPDNVVWLDEVFANRTLQPWGNLRNFGGLVVGLAQQLGGETVAYRTIEPRMTAVAGRDFAARAAVYTRNAQVPDRRDFVIIDLQNQKELA